MFEVRVPICKTEWVIKKNGCICRKNPNASSTSTPFSTKCTRKQRIYTCINNDLVSQVTLTIPVIWIYVISKIIIHIYQFSFIDFLNSSIIRFINIAITMNTTIPKKIPLFLKLYYLTFFSFQCSLQKLSLSRFYEN